LAVIDPTYVMQITDQRGTACKKEPGSLITMPPLRDG